MKRGALRRLANSAQKAFPELDHVRIGIPIEGIPSGLEFRWVFLPAATVQLGRDAVEVRPAAISLHMVSIGQFTQFMREANYQPDADKRYGAGYCEDHWRLNWGKSPKIPAVGVTYYDARAFCKWAGLRLPSEAELHLFFVTLARQGQNLSWGGECWTSTPGAGTSYVLLDGPHHATLDCPFEEFRHEHSPDYYDFPFPAFRVAKTRAGGDSHRDSGMWWPVSSFLTVRNGMTTRGYFVRVPLLCAPFATRAFNRGYRRAHPRRGLQTRARSSIRGGMKLALCCRGAKSRLPQRTCL